MKASGPLARFTGSKRQPIGLGASALAAILWGFGGIFAVLISAPGLVLTFYRLWLGAALLSAIVYVSGRKLTWATVRASWLGGVFLAGDMAMFFSAVKFTSIVDATVIGAFQPVLVLIAARRLFGERMGRWDVFWSGSRSLPIIWRSRWQEALRSTLCCPRSGSRYLRQLVSEARRDRNATFHWRLGADQT
jgi:hypothetical protein